MYCVLVTVPCSPILSKSFNPISAPLIYKNLPPRFSAASIQRTQWFSVAKQSVCWAWESVCEYLPAAGAKEKSSLGCILINLLNLAVQVGYDFVC